MMDGNTLLWLQLCGFHSKPSMSLVLLMTLESRWPVQVICLLINLALFMTFKGHTMGERGLCCWLLIAFVLFLCLQDSL